MQISPSSVIIKRRVRKDLGDLQPLMDSLSRFGQLHPIIINRRNELIAGHRRLEAARRLGWSSINAVVLDRETEIDKLEIELEENIQRHSLNPDEVTDAFIRLERLRKGGFFRRILEFFRRLFRQIFKRFRRRRARRRRLV